MQVVFIMLDLYYEQFIPLLHISCISCLFICQVDIRNRVNNLHFSGSVLMKGVYEEKIIYGYRTELNKQRNGGANYKFYKQYRLLIGNIMH